MSKNNLVACIKLKGKYYVIENVSADTPAAFTEYNDYLRTLITDESRFTYNMGKALIRAHMAQEKADTEYGVFLIRLKK